MKAEMKQIIDAIIFDEEEIDFMKSLADLIENHCGSNNSCESCLFSRYVAGGFGGTDCMTFVDNLRSFAGAESGKLEF